MTAPNRDPAGDDVEPDSSRDWLGTAAAAAYIGVTTRTLYRFINDGAIPAYKLGRVIRIRRTDLDAFLEAHRIAPGSLDHLVPPQDTDDVHP